MCSKFSAKTLSNAMSDLIEQSETRARRVIENIPDGDYQFTDYIDDDMDTGAPIRLSVTATVRESSVILDMSKCDPQTSTAFNLASNGTRHSFMFQSLINFIISNDTEIPINGGIVHPISIIAPAGTLVNAEYPAAVGLRHAITIRLYSALLGALAKAINSVPAAGAGQAAIVVLSTPNETGAFNVSVMEPMGGGGGGQHNMDGIDGIDHASGFLKNTPIESLECHADTIVRRYELVPNTAGAGQFRGGSAIRLDFEILKSGSMVMARGQERLRFRPWGLHGGRAGSLGAVSLNPGTAEERALPKVDVLRVDRGSVVSFRSAGGGGWGNPYERDLDLVLSDLENGLLSPEMAVSQYGVVTKRHPGGGYEIDCAATEETRKHFQGLQKSNDSLYDLGMERELHDEIWPHDACDLLAVNLRALPQPLRIRFRKEILKLVSRERPLSSSNFEQLWQKCSNIVLGDGGGV
jgi:N-methylhydantoinase B